MKDSELIEHSVDAIQDIMLWLREDGSIRLGNAGARRILGCSEDDLKSKTIFDFRPDWQDGGWQSHWKNIKKQTSKSGLGLFQNLHGDNITLRISSNYVKHQNGDEFLCIVGRPSSVDLTRKRGETQSEDYYRKIINYVGDPIFVKDRDHRWVLVNDAFCRALNKPRKEVEGRSDNDYFPREEAEVFWDRDERVFETGEEDINEEKFTARGVTYTMVTRKRLYVDEQGNKYIVGVIKDITKLKDAEEKLQKANDVLEQKVKERTAELEAANRSMQLHIKQLSYLNQTGHDFAQLIEKEIVLTSVFNTFVGHFKQSQIHFCEKQGETFNTISLTRGLKNKISLDACHKLLDVPILKPDQLRFVNGWQAQTGFKVPESLKEYPGYLTIPLVCNAALLGVLQVFTPKGYEERYDEEFYLLDTLSSQAAVALDNANHNRQLEEKARIESELGVARKIQQKYTPADPEIPNIRLKGICLPAYEVGGDYLDYFQNEFGDWVVVIADVCGKGIPAALVMTSLRSSVRAEGKKLRSSKELLVSVNALLGKELQAERSFITCLCIVISENGKRMNYSRAGHPLLISYNGAAQEPKPVQCRGIALGMLLGDTFEGLLDETSFELNPGDKFLAYTDGLDEAMNREKEVYGTDRLFKLLTSNKGHPPQLLIQDILKDVNDYVEGQRQYDDLTLLAIERT